MIVNIQLPNLKLKGATFDDDTLRYNGYRLELWNSDLTKITEGFTIAEEMFFQEEFDITEEELKNHNLDIDDSTLELASLLFDQLQFAEAVHQYTDVNYNSIEEDTVIYDNPVDYKVMGMTFRVFYEKQVIASAIDFKSEYYSNMSLSEIVDDYIDDYYDFIDIEKLVEILREVVDESDKAKLDWPYDDKEYIKMYRRYFEDIVEQVEDNDLFDFYALVEADIPDIETAIEDIQPYMGDLVFGKTITISGWKSEQVYIFETY